jgi:hypothetical protein
MLNSDVLIIIPVEVPIEQARLLNWNPVQFEFRRQDNPHPLNVLQVDFRSKSTVIHSNSNKRYYKSFDSGMIFLPLIAD